MNQQNSNTKRRLSFGFRSGLLGILAFVFALTLVSCSKSKSSNGENDDVKRAAYLIDQHQYSEAIYVLEARLKTDPDYDRARLLLASAYVARAGVKFTDFTGFAKQVLNWNPSSNDQLFPTKDKVLRTVASTIWQIQILMRAFQTIPVPSSPTGYDDIETGLQILVDGGELHGGPSLYRALLRVVIFKRDLGTKYQIIPTSGCGFDVANLVESFSSLDQQLELIMTDYAFAQKTDEQRAKTMATVTQIHKAAANVNAYLARSQSDATVMMIRNAIQQDQTCGQ